MGYSEYTHVVPLDWRTFRDVCRHLVAVLISNGAFYL